MTCRRRKINQTKYREHNKESIRLPLSCFIWKVMRGNKLMISICAEDSQIYTRRPTIIFSFQVSYLVSIVSNEEFEIMSLNQLGHYSYESQIETHKTQLLDFSRRPISCYRTRLVELGQSKPYSRFGGRVCVKWEEWCHDVGRWAPELAANESSKNSSERRFPAERRAKTCHPALVSSILSFLLLYRNGYDI